MGKKEFAGSRKKNKGKTTRWGGLRWAFLRRFQFIRSSREDEGKKKVPLQGQGGRHGTLFFWREQGRVIIISDRRGSERDGTLFDEKRRREYGK